METAQARQRLGQILRQISLERGRFVLSSGRESDYYLDCRKTTLNAEGSFLVGKLVLQAIDERNWRPAAVGGLTLGADPIAAATAVVSYVDERPIDAFIVRKQIKQHATRRQIEGMPPAGSPVVIVEDVVTSGSSALLAAEACRQAELQVLGVVAIVDRQEGGREAIEREDLPLVTLFTARELLDED